MNDQHSQLQQRSATAAKPAAATQSADSGRATLWRRSLLPVLILAISASVAALMYIMRPEPPAGNPPPVSQLVETVTVQPETVQYRIHSQGTVKPRTETTITSEVTGKIVKISDNFVTGGFFRAGEELLRIDPSDYRASVLSAEAALASAEAALAEEQARAEQAIKDWDNLNRVTGRLGREPGDLVLRKPQLARARADVRSARAQLLQARQDLQRTSISLPYDGIVRSRDADLGQFVNVGTTLGVAFAVDVAEVRLPLTDAQQSFVDLPGSGQPAATAESGPSVILRARIGRQEYSWRGRIVRTEGTVDEATRMIYVIAEVRDPYARFGADHAKPLAVGTFVQAEILGHVAENIIALPRALLREDNTVLVADENNKLAIRQVEVTRTTPETAYISNGLDSGDRVITTAVTTPIPGTPLRFEQDLSPDRIGNLAEQQGQSPVSGINKSGTDGHASRKLLIVSQLSQRCVGERAGRLARPSAARMPPPKIERLIT